MEVYVIFSIFFSGCLLFDAGLISETCEDFFTCDGNGLSTEPSQDSSVIQDTSLSEPSTESNVEYNFHPNEFTFFIEQSIFENNVVNHQAWHNRITIVLFERDDMDRYPKIDMDGCLIFLEFNDVEEVEPNAQSFFGFDITSLVVNADSDPNSLCQDMDPNILGTYIELASQATWSVGIGEITNSVYLEYTKWIQENENDLLDTEKGSNFSDPFDFINTVYIKSDWSGSIITLAPGVTLSYQSNAGGSINQNELNILQGATTPPNGFYFSRSLFPYTLFDLDEM
jgi:hypothetical protein